MERMTATPPAIPGQGPGDTAALSSTAQGLLDGARTWLWRLDSPSGDLAIHGDMEPVFGRNFRRLDEILEVVHPADLVLVRSALARAMELGESGQFAARGRGAGGDWLHFLVALRPEPAPDGGFTVHGVFQDVTALVEAQAQMGETVRLSAKAAGLAGVGYWRLDLRTGQYLWSDETFRLYGLDPSKGPPSIEATANEYCHPEDRERLRLHRDLHGDEPGAEIEVRIMRPDGEIRHVVVRSAPERNDAGEITARMGALIDVTDIRRAEAAAIESEQRYRFLAETAPDMIARLTVAGEIKYVSPGSLQVFGYTPEEQMRQSPVEMVHPDDIGRVAAAITGLVDRRQPRLPEPLVYRARHKDGHWIWIESNPTVVFDSRGEPLETIDIVRDVTRTKLFEAELDEARRKAEAAAAAKAAFLANMSHELRTPLTSIIGFSQLLGSQDGLPEDSRRYASRISGASEALLAIINDVLDFSKLEAGHVELERLPLSIRRLVDETTGLIAIQAAAKGLRIESRVSPRAPAMINGDVARLRQVLLNFLSNALKFTDAGAITVKVDWSGRGPRGQLKVRVTDTGQGIAPDKIDRLFERFSQADVSINRTHGGTGLGLAISRGIVELMGGKIGVETRLGTGSSFWFEIPAEAAAEVEAETAAQGTFEQRPLHLLMVDDTEVNRELVKLMLAPVGVTIDEAAGGAEGVKAAMTRAYDLILMDVRMPGVDGLEATRVIRATSRLNRETPILALTADVQPENAVACKSAGMNDVLAKPIAPRQLLAALARWGKGPGADSRPSSTPLAST
jgi:PAS domain S-box-containing protein